MENPAAHSFVLVGVGDEVLSGGVVNTDAAFLASELTALGCTVTRHTVVSDDGAEVARALADAYRDADAVILTGGLGPTYDDLTKAAVAAYFGVPLEMSEEALDNVKTAFARLGKPMTENNLAQAMMPRGTETLQNDWGTAPGVWYEHPDGRLAVLLPGPPAELRPLFRCRVRPRLLARRGGHTRTLDLHLRGIGESAAEQILRPLMQETHNPAVATYVGNGDVRLSVTANAASPEEAETMCRETADRVRATEVGQYVYYETSGPEEFSLMPQLAVIRTLAERGLTAAAAESCTAGLVAASLADVPGSSAVLLGGVVSYANEVKKNLLGVRGETLRTVGAVSVETAREMADGVRRITGASIGVSTTGIAGPGGGTAEKPVGTVCFGISSARGTRALRRQFNPALDREEIRRRAALEALLLLLEEARSL